MEFIDEDTRPRFVLKSRSTSSFSSSSSPPPETLTISKTHAACCFAAAAVFLIAAVSLSSHTSIVFTLLIWFSLSLLLAPFAPASVTGGDPRVGRGDPLPPPAAPKSGDPNEPRKRSAVRSNPNKPSLPSFSYPVGTLNNKPDLSIHTVKSEKKDPIQEEDLSAADFEILKRQISKPVGTLNSKPGLSIHAMKSEKKDQNPVQEEDWTAEDFEILKRQMSKHPAGAPGRWERVAEAFKGRHAVEAVIREAKSLSEKGVSGDDSFAEFLKRRKPLDKRVDDANGGGVLMAGNGGWSSGEDIALLNALKAFPKDVQMRWEKVAAAVPGKSKAECVRRVSELKRDFRSSKTSER